MCETGLGPFIRSINKPINRFLPFQETGVQVRDRAIRLSQWKCMEHGYPLRNGWTHLMNGVPKSDRCSVLHKIQYLSKSQSTI